MLFYGVGVPKRYFAPYGPKIGVCVDSTYRGAASRLVVVSNWYASILVC
jgi:hypothetical protein